MAYNPPDDPFDPLDEPENPNYTGEVGLTFIQQPVITNISPSSAYAGATITVFGDNLGDVNSVRFIDKFQRAVKAADFSFGYAGDQRVLNVTVPTLDATLLHHLVEVGNELGVSVGDVEFTPFDVVQTSIPNVSGDVTFVSTDKIAINAEISTDSPNRLQGFEILKLCYNPARADHSLLIETEVTLHASFWGAAVVALFKDNEWTPRKAWTFFPTMGTVARLGYILDPIGSTAGQCWSVRVGRQQGTYPIIYVNRNLQTSVPYGGATSSHISITEIQNT